MKNKSISNTIIKYVSISVIFIIFVNTLIVYHDLKNNFIQETQKASKKSLEVLKTNIQPLIEAYAIHEYKLQIKTELMLHDYLAIVVEDYNLAQVSGEVNYRVGYIRDNDAIVEFAENKHQKLLKQSYKIEDTKIYADEKQIGKITIYQTDTILNKQIEKLVLNEIINAFLTILTLVFIIYFLIQKIIIKPVNELIDSLKITDSQGIPNHLLPIMKDSEYKYLAQTINNMIDTIKSANIKMKEQTKEIESEKNKYKHILDLSPDGIFIMDLEGNLIEYSLKATELLGYTTHEMKELRVFDWDKQISKEQFYETVVSLRHSPIDVERVYTKKEGSSYLAQITASLITIDDNEYIYSSVRDITQKRELEDEIIHDRNFISTIVNTANAIIAIIKADGTMSLLNHYGENFIGYSQEEVASKPYFWKKFLNKNVQENVVDIISEAKKGNIVKQYQNTWMSRSGEERMFEWSNQIVTHDDGTLNYIFTIGIDIEQQAQAQQQVISQKEELEAIFNTALDGIAILDLDTKHLSFNKKYLDLLECTQEELQNRYCYDFTAPEYLDESKEIYQKVIEDGYYENFERICITKNGKQKRLNSSIALMNDKKRFLMSTVDHTELYDAMQLIKRQTYIDELTQLNNRKSYNRRILESIASYQRYKTVFSILMFDIDFFKSINDTYGHQKGDEVLVELGSIAKAITRANDYVFRIGGEEFMIILTNTPLNNAVSFAEKLRSEIEFGVKTLNDRAVTVSIGVTEVQENDTENSIFKRVDSCLYNAKETGRNKVVSSEVVD